MMKSKYSFTLGILLLTDLFFSSNCQRALRAMFPKVPPFMLQNGIDPGSPLFLTPYLEKGQADEAHFLSEVTALPGWYRKSYSGFITVNETYNSNMFFWFFPSQTDPANAPVLMWLQGGPGGSSLFGLFVEHGPFYINENTKLLPRNVTWNEKYSLLYVDNPVGTGFSFTKADQGYAQNEEDVGRDLYSFLEQFFQIYKEYQQNDFYVTGESYAGKYVPAISYKIHTENQGHPKVMINFKGMAIGDGLCDPLTMMPKYADFMFNLGLLDENQRDYFQSMTDKAVVYIQNQQYLEAFKLFDMLLNGDITKEVPYFKNVSGLSDYYNFLHTQSPTQYDYYGTFLADPLVRRAIHVGNLTYNDGLAVETHLLEDIMASVKPWIAVLMDNYKVMIYNGQLDIIIAVPLTEAWLQTVEWSGLPRYKTADRLIWKVNPSDSEVAGYVRQVDNFYQVIVRNAGHILPADQPVWGYDMIQRFVENRSFA
ncbi:probable serine carboxypeptidase CPVL [Pomacea canaliculata]|uniref:probable serine carboxypeptidase CPVL n=1 Tax=Pomacea canaliculata TaxID=400727 RepID=UPI000D72A313|nr:probable serine carboxypeptidase CPVL [Pomacea canaliculata]